MNKTEFKKKLGKLISPVPEPERSRAVAFYLELIDDRIEEGMKEEQAVHELGGLQEIAEKILSESSVPLKRSKGANAMMIFLIFITSPIWISILAVIASFIFAGWSVVIAIYCVFFGLIVSFLYAVLSSPFVMTNHLLSGLFQLGAGLICGGLGVLLLYGTNKLAKSWNQFVFYFCRKIKSSIQEVFVRYE